MSAIACKIVICGGQAESLSKISADVANDLASKPELAKRAVEAQEKYCDKMNEILKRVSE